MAVFQPPQAIRNILQHPTTRIEQIRHDAGQHRLESGEDKDGSEDQGLNVCFSLSTWAVKKK